MIGQCDLDPEYNKCPHFIKDKLSCKENNTVCGFYRADDKKEMVTDCREPKWFEKYYKR